MKLNAQQNMYVTWAGLGLAAVGVGYLLIKYAIPAITKAIADSAKKAAGNISKGTGDTLNAVNQGLSNNDLTNQSTDFAGNTVNYSGHGPVSTVAAATNDLSGGILSSAGEWLGSAIYDWTHVDYDPNASNSQNNSQTPAAPSGTSVGLNADMGGQNFGVTGGGW